MNEFVDGFFIGALAMGIVYTAYRCIDGYIKERKEKTEEIRELKEKLKERETK